MSNMALMVGASFSSPSPPPLPPPPPPPHVPRIVHTMISDSQFALIGSALLTCFILLVIIVRLITTYYRDQEAGRNADQSHNLVEGGGTEASQIRLSQKKKRAGLPKELIDAFPTRTISERFVLSEEGLCKECAVCLGDFEEGDVMKTLPLCGHAFHADCVDQWLLARSSCPLCRVDMNPPSNQQLIDGQGEAEGHQVEGHAGEVPSAAAAATAPAAAATAPAAAAAAAAPAAEAAAPAAAVAAAAAAAPTPPPAVPAASHSIVDIPRAGHA